jgi:hypothetical protein
MQEGLRGYDGSLAKKSSKNYIRIRVIWVLCGDVEQNQRIYKLKWIYIN